MITLAPSSLPFELSSDCVELVWTVASKMQFLLAKVYMFKIINMLLVCSVQSVQLTLDESRKH